MDKNNFNFKQWQKYNTSIWILLHGKLSEWEGGFLKSVYKKLGQLTDKQIIYLDKIVVRYLR
jgi:hypothetical protein